MVERVGRPKMPEAGAWPELMRESALRSSVEVVNLGRCQKLEGDWEEQCLPGLCRCSLNYVVLFWRTHGECE